MVTFSAFMMAAYEVVTNNTEYIKRKKAERKSLSLRHIIGIIIFCIVILAFIYIITGGEGHIAKWIEKFISKL